MNPNQGALPIDYGTSISATMGTSLGNSINSVATKAYVDTVNNIQIAELEDRVEKLEKLLDKILIEFMPEYKI